MIGMPRKGARMLLPVALALVQACSAGDFTEPGGNGGLVGGAPPIGADPDVVGRWSRTLFFLSPAGEALSSETIWSFRSDQSLLRQVVAVNYTAGLTDTVFVTGRWATERPETIVIQYLPLADNLPTRFRYRVDGELLYLDSLSFRLTLP